LHSRPMPFQQRTNTSCYLIEIPTRGFTAAVSVFRGTPPPKPFNCKSVSNHSGARFRPRWAEPTGEELLLLCAVFSLAAADIIETSLVYRSQIVAFRCGCACRFQGNKKPCLHGVSRVEKSLYRFVTCSPPVDPSQSLGFARDTTWIAQG